MSVKLSTNVAKNFDLSNFRLDLTHELNLSANVVKLDIQKHIREERRIDTEAQQAPLSPVTVARKLAKGGKPAQNATKILREYDNLIFNQRIDKATPDRQSVLITIGPERAEIGFYLQEGTENMPERPFFGISEQAEKNILSLVDKKIERLLKNL